MAAIKYLKKFNYNVKKDSGEAHLKTNLIAWVQAVFWYFEGENTVRDKETVCEPIADLLFDRLYNLHNNLPIEKWHFWNENNFNEWVEKAGVDEQSRKRNSKKESEITACHYCKCSPEELEVFYNHVDSDRYQRGMNFEIDRRHGRMKSYLDMIKYDYKDFIIKNMIEIEKCNDDSRIFEEFLDALSKDKEKNFLGLPAPYNKANCVFACYWCNNAKTDAFTDKEFETIGAAIRTQIKKIQMESETVEPRL